MVGTLEPRKAHQQVLEAFEQLWNDGQKIQLVIVGKQGWMVESLAQRIRTHPELGKRLFWLENVSDEYLEKIYAVGDGRFEIFYIDEAKAVCQSISGEKQELPL